MSEETPDKLVVTINASKPIYFHGKPAVEDRCWPDHLKDKSE